jgi:protein-tyrosine phosphatase
MALPGRLDFHSHLIPGVDDGAADVPQSLAALRAFAAQGVTTCITTPHFDGSLTRQPRALEARLAELDAGWERLAAAREGVEGIPTMARGVELMLDVPDVDVSDPRLRLAGGPFVLCEFPAMLLPPNAELAVKQFVARGWTPIIAHPERYRNHEADLMTIGRCRVAGAYLQVNAGSLVGQYGSEAQTTAVRLLTRGWVDYLSSDHHARGVPATAAAITWLEGRDAAEQAHQLTVSNPRRILAGERPIPVTPIERRAPRRPWWQRLFR